MKSFNSLWKQVALALTFLASGAASATTLVLDSTKPNNSVTLDLAAGTYDVVYENGAWNPWSGVSGCDAQGTGCWTGWENRYNYITPTHAGVFWDGGRYATAEQAKASAGTLKLNLLNPGQVTFIIQDSNYIDNSGSITLSVIAVPEPSEVSMLIAGAALLGVVVRRRQQGRLS